MPGDARSGQSFPDVFASGPYLPLDAAAGARRILIVADHHTGEDLPGLVADIHQLQLHQPDVKPILLIGDASSHELRDAGIVYESSFSRSEWERLPTCRSFPDYLRSRVSDMVELYGVHAVVTAEPGLRIRPDLAT